MGTARYWHHLPPAPQQQADLAPAAPEPRAQVDADLQRRRIPSQPSLATRATHRPRPAQRCGSAAGHPAP